MGQIDLVRNALLGKANPDIWTTFGVRIYQQGDLSGDRDIDRREFFDAGITCTHDADASFASANFPVIKPFSLDPGRLWIIEWYVGWNNSTALAFKGEIQSHGKSHWNRRDTLTAGGVLKRTEVGLAPALDVKYTAPAAFYNLDGEDQEDLHIRMEQAEVPLGAQYGIHTDGDIIIKILELYGIKPIPGVQDPDHLDRPPRNEGWNHSIESSWWKPAMLLPIIWQPGESGWSKIQELDRCTRYRTYDAAVGAVFRRPVYGGPPSGTPIRFQDYDGNGSAADLLSLEYNETYTVYNQVRVTGIPIASLAGTPDPFRLEENVFGVAPDGVPPASYFVPDPPRIRTDDALNSQLIETDEDARRMAYERLGYLSIPVQEVSLTTFGCSDIDVGTGVGITSQHIGVDGLSYAGFLISHQLSGAPFRSQMKLRGATSDLSLPPPPLPGIPPNALYTVEMFLEYIISTVATPLPIGNPLSVQYHFASAGNVEDAAGWAHDNAGDVTQYPVSALVLFSVGSTSPHAATSANGWTQRFGMAAGSNAYVSVWSNTSQTAGTLQVSMPGGIRYAWSAIRCYAYDVPVQVAVRSVVGSGPTLTMPGGSVSTSSYQVWCMGGNTDTNITSAIYTPSPSGMGWVEDTGGGHYGAAVGVENTSGGATQSGGTVTSGLAGTTAMAGVVLVFSTVPQP